MSVNDAVRLPEESSPVDEIAAELALLHAEQGGAGDQRDTARSEEHAVPAADRAPKSTADTGKGGACATGLHRGPNDSAVQVPLRLAQLPQPDTPVAQSALRSCCHMKPVTFGEAFEWHPAGLAAWG